EGRLGLERAHREVFDAMIVDRMLPGMDGLAIVAALRAAHDQTPVLVLSAMGDVDDRVEGLRAGCDDYLTKPFAFAELVMRVKALLRRGPIARSSVLRVADLEVDRLSQQVRRGGRRIELTPKEYALLEYLAANPGRVFSRTMIIEHVWDQSFEGLTNIVDVYVRHLRSKIDDPFAVKLIRTVRGVGYGLGAGPAE
ncbi:MAG: winged helix-turn-helix domain-containing protein, partial [Steroidobacteraceae bacterium]